MQDPLQPARRGPSRRTRPSLASMPDSGFQPSRPQTQDNSRNSTFPRSFSLFRNNNVLEEHPTEADTFDLGVTSQLLESPTRDPETTVRGSRSHTTRSMRSFRFPLGGGGSVKSTSGSQSLSPNSISRSQTISSAWSGMSNRLFTDSAVGTVSDKPTTDELFSSQFNKLARKHGIQSFPDNYKTEPAGSVSVSSASNANNSSGDSTPIMHGNRLWNKLLGRTPSSIDISKSYGNMKLSLGRRRGSSIGDLAAIGRGKRDSLKGMHLEDMIRLGGVSPFTLPEGLSPGDLLIPTCMHASASYILTHGLKTPGLFRVAGNLNTTYSLYDYYQRQFEENNNEAVVQTIALAKLPTSIKFHVHDVAHLFKKLLHGLPGGLLGSPAVFQALYNVHSFVYPDPSLGEQMSRKVKPRMIALAIASINLHFRIALICAVFGLLRAVSLASEQEQESKLKDPHNLFEAMKEDALGIIFGPLLLGDKSEQILLQEMDDRGGLLVLPKISPVPDISSKRGRYSHRHSSAYNKMQNEKTKRAAVVCDMLINNWEEISYQLKKIDALNITAQAYDLPSLKQELPEENQEERLLSQSIRATKTASMRSRRGVSTIRSRIASDDESILPFQGLNPPSFHKPPPQIGDLMQFSTHDTLKEDDETPYLSAPPYLSMPMSTVPEAPSPNRSPTRSIGAKSTPGSPNWVAHNPETPIHTPSRRPNFSVKPSQLRQVADYDPVTPSSASSSSNSSGASSPGLEVAAQAATRLQRAFLGGQTRMGSDNTIIASEMLPEKPRVPSETPTEIPDFEFTPTNFRDFDLGEFSLSTDPETTPKPLNIKNKIPKTRTIPAFSIFEDKTKCKSPVLASPMLTLTRPNARSEVKLTHKATKSMSKVPMRPPTRRNQSESPSRPTTAPLQPATPNLHLRGISIDSDVDDRYVWREDHTEAPSPTKKRGNSALHTEIRRLQRLLDVKTEEAAQAKKDLELAQNVANAGALSYMLREAQEEVKVWKNRAEWAEKQLRTKGIVESRRGVEGPRAMGVPKNPPMRYSLG